MPEPPAWIFLAGLASTLLGAQALQCPPGENSPERCQNRGADAPETPGVRRPPDVPQGVWKTARGRRHYPPVTSFPP